LNPAERKAFQDHKYPLESARLSDVEVTLSRAARPHLDCRRHELQAAARLLETAARITARTSTIAPTRALAAETLKLEHTLSDLVNQAYALTPAEIALMWQTAPPRMPVPPPATSLERER
jgi:hypothetical protein